MRNDTPKSILRVELLGWHSGLGPDDSALDVVLDLGPSLKSQLGLAGGALVDSLLLVHVWNSASTMEFKSRRSITCRSLQDCYLCKK